MATARVGQLFQPRMTFSDYLQLPDDGMRYEVLEGELVVTPAPEFRHQLVSLNLEFLMESWRREKRDPGRVLHAPFDVVLALDTVLQPDILYMSEDTLGLLSAGRLHGAPDVAVEIHNQASAARDRVRKLQLYARHRVKEYWLVDLEGSTITMLALGNVGFEIFAAGGGDTLLASRVMEGFSVRPQDVFEHR